MRRYNQRLFRVVRGIVGDAAEAEDVVQDAYLRAFVNLSGFRGESSVSTWLTRIAVHEGLARLRGRRRLVALAEPRPPQADDASAEADPQRRLEGHELRAALEAAVDALPSSLRTVFVLRELEGLSTDAVAQALELTAANVRVRFHRAKAALRDHLDAQIGREIRQLYLFGGERCDRLVAGTFGRIAAANAGLRAGRASRGPDRPDRDRDQPVESDP